MALRRSDLVFSGRVAKERPFRIHIKGGRLEYAGRFTIDVYRVWKGSVGHSIDVVTEDHALNCGYPFELGRDVLVYASRPAGGLMGGLIDRAVGALTLDEAAEVLDDTFFVLMNPSVLSTPDTSNCTRTADLPSARADLRVLGPGSAPSGGWLSALLVLAAAGLVLALAGHRARAASGVLRADAPDGKRP